MLYSGYLDQHLNYFSLLRSSILHTANFFAHWSGLDLFAGSYTQSREGKQTQANTKQRMGRNDLDVIFFY